MNSLKKLVEILFSMLATVVLLGIFAIAIGYATFAENDLGTEYAKNIVYNAKWFEFLMILLIINLVGSIFRYKIVTKRKFSILLFHLSFIVILIGAAITRYAGSEGVMHIREGETSNEISSEKSSVGITAELNGEKVEKTIEKTFTENGSNDFSEEIKIGPKTIAIESELFVPNSVETIVPDEQGEPALSLFVMNSQSQGMDFILLGGETTNFEDISFAFADSTKKAMISFSLVNNTLYLKPTVAVSTMSMMAKSESILKPGISYPAEQKTIYKAGDVIFVLKTYLEKAKKNLTQLTPDMNKSGIVKQSKDAIIFKVSDGNLTKRINVLSTSDGATQASSTVIGDVKITLSYGMLAHKLPFSISLRDFQLDRYAGSNSPSSYASEITLTDTELKTERPFRIYMNNILNYRGYRFFQSSYDPDEKGTVLSVNHDYWGTMVTYAGYLFLLIGMILTLFNKNSRFFTLLKLSKALQDKRKVSKTLLLAGLIFASGFVSASSDKNEAKKEHFNALSSLLIQDEIQGRIEPISTYASDLFRKISKKTSFKNASALEVIIAMSANPSKWQNEAVIKIAHADLAKELGAVDELVSFNQLFDFENNGVYKLSEKVNNAYQKDPSERNQYEKELINVDERVNICNGILSGELLRIFPVAGHENDKWMVAGASPANPHTAAMEGMGVCPAGGKSGSASMDEAMMGTTAECPASGMKSDKHGATNGATECPVHGSGSGMTGPMSGNRMQTDLQENTPEKLLSNYFSALNQAFETDDWSFANMALANLKSYQLINGGVQLPQKSKINLEVLYNKLSIFLTLALLYGLVGFILLTLHIVNILKYNKKIEYYLDKSIYPLFLMFGFYTAGLAMRWYISGHAPWSNGYETMIFVGWASALSGIIFARRSPITLAVTSLLAAIAMSVAGMSWMNPEITNLVPVLKSYWLVIHVAVITSSYGFFAMASMLGLFNLCLMIARNKKNKKRLNESILEFSYIIELALIVGLFMLTIGTFLGGVWANESWGRYWGWDSKETWALVSVLVYSIILHLRNIPKTNNLLLFNSLSLISFGTVIMTFFGVNYYLSGMHSYGKGTPPPIPLSLYLIVIGIVVLIVWASNSEKKMKG